MTSDRIKHLLFAPDGNRRYAENNGISFDRSYYLAAKKCNEIIEWSFTNNLVDELSIWTLSEYNLERPSDELTILNKAVIDSVKDIVESDIVKKLDLKVNVIGELDVFFKVYNDMKREDFENMLIKTHTHKRKNINILMCYNSDKELERAMKICIKDNVKPTFYNLSLRWSFSPIDLFFRTGYPNNFNRLSHLYPGIDQARLISVPTPPQELKEQEFKEILKKFLTLKDRYVKK